VKKLMVYLDEDMHEDLRQLAFHKKTTMAALVRYALDATFEEDLDDISSQRALEEAAQHPEEMMTLEQYLEERGLAVPSGAYAASASRPRKVAEGRRPYRSGTSRKSAR
jgi:hypothetical protein